MLDILVVPVNRGRNCYYVKDTDVGISIFNSGGKHRIAIHIGTKIAKTLRWAVGDYISMGPINSKAGYWGIRRTPTGLKLSKPTSTTSSLRIQGGTQFAKYFPAKSLPMTPVSFEDVDGELLIKIPE